MKPGPDPGDRQLFDEMIERLSRFQDAIRTGLEDVRRPLRRASAAFNEYSRRR